MSQVIRIYNPFRSNIANTFLATKACKDFSITSLLLRRIFRAFSVSQSQVLSAPSGFLAFSSVSNTHAGPPAAARVQFLTPGGLDCYRHFPLLPSTFSRQDQVSEKTRVLFFALKLLQLLAQVAILPERRKSRPQSCEPLALHHSPLLEDNTRSYLLAQIWESQHTPFNIVLYNVKIYAWNI